MHAINMMMIAEELAHANTKHIHTHVMHACRDVAYDAECVGVTSYRHCQVKLEAHRV